MSEVRMPTQKRSIEKRNKIIEKGFELMCERGYYNTGTTEIAEYAGVSTGIVYQYFNDKKEIFIEGVKNYANNIMYPMLNVLEDELVDYDNLEAIFTIIVDKSIETHTMSKKAHEELMAMSHLDEDVSIVFKDSELDMTNRIVSILKKSNINLDNLNEKVHIILGIIDNLCHEIVYHQHNEFNYDYMKKEVINIIVSTLK